MEFEIYLNGSKLEKEPQELQDFQEVLELDEDVRGLLLKFPTKLTFIGDGYGILAAERAKTGGYCQTVDVLIKGKATQNDGFVDKVRGTIFIVDVDFELSTDKDGQTASCTIFDQSYSAKIHNNRKTDFWLNANVSKNGVALTPITPIALKVFRPSDGAEYAATRDVYDLKDSLIYLVSAMTDNGVSFASNWYDGLPDDEKICICYGHELRTANSSLPPFVNWQDLFAKTIALLYNLWFIVQTDDAGNATIRIENDDYLHSGVRAKRIDYIESLKQSFERDGMFRSVELGQEDSIKDVSGTYSLPYLQFLSFVEEEYFVSGVCNSENSLELRSEYLIDTNAIEASIGGDDDYDDNIFLIQYDSSTNKATKGYYLTGDSVTPTYPALYNEQMLNSNVANRWAIQGNPSLFYANQDDSFQAQLLADTATFTANGIGSTVLFDTHPYPFDNEIADANGNYDHVTNFRYLVPVGGQGYYVTKLIIDWEITAQSGGMDIVPELYLHRHETVGGGGGLLTFAQYFQNPLEGESAVGTYQTILTFGTSMEEQQFIDARIKFTARGFGFGTPSLTMRVLKESTFQTILVARGGGDFADIDPNQYYINLFEFKQSFATEDWADLKADPTKFLEINTNGNDNRISYIRKVSHTLATRETDFELIANNDQQVK